MICPVCAICSLEVKYLRAWSEAQHGWEGCKEQEFQQTAPVLVFGR